VDAIIRLFGGLCYFISLSESYVGADFSDTLIFDAHRGEVVKSLLVNIQGEFLQLNHVRESKDVIWDDRVKSGEWLLKFIDSAIRGKPLPSKPKMKGEALFMA